MIGDFLPWSVTTTINHHLNVNWLWVPHTPGCSYPMNKIVEVLGSSLCSPHLFTNSFKLDGWLWPRHMVNHHHRQAAEAVHGGPVARKPSWASAVVAQPFAGEPMMVNSWGAGDGDGWWIGFIMVTCDGERMSRMVNHGGICFWLEHTIVNPITGSHKV